MGRTKGSRNSPKPSTPNSGGGEIRQGADQSIDSAASNAESPVIDQVSIEGGDVTENVNDLTNIVSDMTEIVTLVVDKEKEGAENWNQLKVRLDDIAKKHQKDKQITKIFTTADDAPQFYDGMFGGAPIAKDIQSKIRWSNGEETDF